MLFAAADGNLQELIHLNASGSNLTGADYDGRTPLHLAASNGHSKIVKYLLVQVKKGDTEDFKAIWMAQDRFGNNPIDDAIREGHINCQEILESVAVAHEGMDLGLGSRGNRRSSGFTLDSGVFRNDSTGPSKR